MADLNVEDVEELYRRRIADQVTALVDANIRRRYVWINIAAGLAFVVMTWLGGAALITSLVKAGVDAQVSVEVNSINELLGRIAENQNAVRAGLYGLDERVLANKDQQRTLEQQIAASREQAEIAQQKLQAIVSSTNTLRKSTDDIELLKATIADFARLGATVAQLQDAVVALTKSEPAPSRELLAASTKLASAPSAADIEQRLDTAARSLDQSTVFLQFSGAVNRPTIERLSQELKSTYGYRIPGEERIASNVREVRFFHARDRQLATDVAERTSTLLAQLGFGTINVGTTDLQNWTGVKPRPGTVELWLGHLPDPA